MLASRRHFRFVTLMCGALFIYVVALIFSLPALFFFCACLLAQPAVSYFLAAYGLRAIRGERRLPARLWPGEKVDVELRLRLESPLPKCLLRIDEQLPDGLAGDPRHPPGAVVPMLWSDPHVHRYPLLAVHRGLYRLPPLRCTAVDAYDLFTASREVGPGDELLVYPATVPVKNHALHEPSMRGQIRRRRPVSDGTDFRATREYRPGDPLRRIHWRSTARRGEPIVMEFEEPASLDLFMVLDAGPAGVVGEGKRTNFETGVTLVASLIEHELERGNAIGVLVEAEARLLLPLTDQRHRQLAFFEALATVEPVCERSFATVLATAEGDLPEGAQVVLVTGDPDLAIGDSVRRLLGRQHPVALCYLDHRGYPGADGAETGARFIAAMRQLGAAVFAIRPGAIAEGLAAPL